MNENFPHPYDYYQVIKAIDPKSVVQIEMAKDDLSTLVWLDGNPTNISKADIEAKMTELQAEYDAKQYQRERATAYPSIQEQLDMQYWDKVNGTTNWENAIAKVKSDIPKA